MTTIIRSLTKIGDDLYRLDFQFRPPEGRIIKDILNLNADNMAFTNRTTHDVSENPILHLEIVTQDFAGSIAPTEVNASIEIEIVGKTTGKDVQPPIAFVFIREKENSVYRWENGRLRPDNQSGGSAHYPDWV